MRVGGSRGRAGGGPGEGWPGVRGGPGRGWNNRKRPEDGCETAG